MPSALTLLNVGEAISFHWSELERIKQGSSSPLPSTYTPSTSSPQPPVPVQPRPPHLDDTPDVSTLTCVLSALTGESSNEGESSDKDMEDSSDKEDTLDGSKTWDKVSDKEGKGESDSSRPSHGALEQALAAAVALKAAGANLSSEDSETEIDQPSTSVQESGGVSAAHADMQRLPFTLH